MWFDIFMVHLAMILIIGICFYFGFYYGKRAYRSCKYYCFRAIRLLKGRWRPKGVSIGS